MKIKEILLADIEDKKIKGSYNSLVKSSTFAASLLFAIEGLQKEHYLGKKYVDRLRDISIDIEPEVGHTYGRSDFQYFANSGSNSAGMIFNKTSKVMYIQASLDPKEKYQNEFDANESTLYYVPQGFDKKGWSSLNRKVNQLASSSVNRLFIDPGDHYYLYAGEYKPFISTRGELSWWTYKGVPYEIGDKLAYSLMKRFKKKKVFRSDEMKKLRTYKFNKPKVKESDFTGKGSDNRESLARAKNNHESMVDMVATYYKEKYMNDTSLRLFEGEEDLVVVTDAFTKVIEVKTTRQSNLKDQLKTAFGQIVFYNYKNHKNGAAMEVVYSGGIIPVYISNSYLGQEIELSPIGKYMKK